MLISELEHTMTQYCLAHGRSPLYVEVNPQDWQNLLLDITFGQPPLGLTSYLVNGISVHASGTLVPGEVAFWYKGSQEVRAVRKPPGITAGAALRSIYDQFWTYSEALEAEKPRCDCGAEKCNQPGHSHWCSTQVRA